jgi:hypothetical protein
MLHLKHKMFIIKLPYWLGIAADALWAIALFVPLVFGILLGNPEFNPDIQVRLIMGIGGSLMTGWTFLLLWAVRQPIERRAVSLLTAFPVIFGLFIVTLLGYMEGNTSNIWILIKTIFLFICMVTSYVFAGKIEKENIDRGKNVI